MNKDNVVIEEGGTRYVFEPGECAGACAICPAECKCGPGTLIGRVCGDGHKLKCISATKITPQPRIYHAWDRGEPRHELSAWNMIAEYFTHK